MIVLISATILGAFLIVGVGMEYAFAQSSIDPITERHQNHTLTNYGNGTYTHVSGLPNYIFDNSLQEYIPYTYSDGQYDHTLFTYHNILELDKETCEFSLFDNYYLHIFSESIYLLNEVPTDDSCNTLYDSNTNTLTAITTYQSGLIHSLSYTLDTETMQYHTLTEVWTLSESTSKYPTISIDLV